MNFIKIIEDKFHITEYDKNYRKVIAINVVFLLSLLVYASFAILNFYEGQTRLTLFDIVFLILTFILYRAFFITKKIELFAYIASAFIFFGILGAILVAPKMGNILFSVIFYPMFALLLLGRKKGIMTSFILLVIATLIIHPYIGNTVMLSQYFRMTMMSVSILIIIYFYEHITSKVLRTISQYFALVDKNIIQFTVNENLIITDISTAFESISHFKKPDLLNMHFKKILFDEDLFLELKETLSKLDLSGEHKTEIACRHKNGGYFYLATVFSKTVENNKLVHYKAICHDVTDKKRLEKLSNTDPLTNLYNRRFFNVIFARFFNSSRRHNHLFAFMILDIDNFKHINDHYGHQVGDDILVNLANTIQGSLKRSDDYCFRLGGEEFGIVFTPKSQKQALVFANLIRQNIETSNTNYPTRYKNLVVTVSIGLVCKTLDNEENENLIYKQADNLMYQAKMSGKNKVCSNIEDN